MFSMVATMTFDGTLLTNNDSEWECSKSKGMCMDLPDMNKYEFQNEADRLLDVTRTAHQLFFLP